MSLASLWRGSSERERLNPGGANGFSEALETELPSLASPRSPRSPQEGRQLRRMARLAVAGVILVVFLATMVTLVAATVIRCRREGGAGCLIPKQAVAAEWGGASLWPPRKLVSRIGFGSCASYDVRHQPVWEEGVIPSAPDAWVWLGDMYYGDEPEFNCGPQNANATQCVCESDWLKQPPYMCMAGDLDNARDKMVAQLQQPGYQAFLRYACPAWHPGATAPPGDNIELCPRAVLGTYDDHDYGVNNLNRRLPSKHLYKQVFLDALGVPPSSPRRAADRGIHWAYTLNPGTEQAVDLVLLDERYERAPLPCEVRDEWCRNEVLPNKQHPQHAWCDDFLHTGGSGQAGSCCKADRAIFWGWCQQAANRKDPLWEVACDPSSPLFGSQPLAVQPNGSLQPRDTGQAVQTEEDSTFCELLGWPQRQWLDRVLGSSSAPVKVIASGSVLFGSSPLDNNTAENRDDWDCYRPAQLNLLHTLQRHAAGGACIIVITGDYHYSDVKVAKPGTAQLYSAAYQTAGWTMPIYQVMASGMTNSTARPDAPCQGSRKEWSGLRVEGDCGFVKLPSFGLLEFDWSRRRVSLQVRGAEAPQGGKVLQQLTISLDTCQPV